MAGISKSWAVAAVLLAAGASSRMGKPKLLLPWGDTTVIGHLIALWKKLGAAQIAVVVASPDSAMEAELNRVGFPARGRIINANPQIGMLSSIQCAARWDQWQIGLTHWAIVLGDQPHLKLETLIRLRKFSESHPENICQPAHQGCSRHPVILPKNAFSMLNASTHSTLKDFLKSVAINIKTIEIDDPGLDLDVDRPSDYEQAVKLQGGSI